MADPARGDSLLDAAELRMLTDALRSTMTTATGDALDRALADLGWGELLTESPDIAVPSVFRLLGETGAHASVLLDVLRSADPALPAEVALPFAGGRWVVWVRADGRVSSAADHGEETAEAAPLLDADLPLRPVDPGTREGRLSPSVTAAGRRAVGWWLLGAGHAMLSLARAHALERVQFGRPLASFQAVRHRLAETLVALDGAEAALAHADDEFGALLAKAAAGRAATTAARHCQQVLGGIGFTAEHDLHRHVRRVLVLNGLLGSTRELVREAGREVRRRGRAPRIANL